MCSLKALSLKKLYLIALFRKLALPAATDTDWARLIIYPSHVAQKVKPHTKLQNHTKLNGQACLQFY